MQLLVLRVLGGPCVEHAARLGDAEVGDLHLALERQQDVLGRHVAVDDAQRPHLVVAASVRVVEPFRDLGRDVDAQSIGSGTC